METIKRINGNGKPYETGLPKIIILGFMNDGGLAHIKENTGLEFEKNGFWESYSAQPETSNQIAALFMTYNFKTRYFDNSSHTNVLMLKSDHHTGFDVDSICYDCCKENGIHVGTMVKGERRSC